MNDTERENLAKKIAALMNSGATDDLRSTLDSISRRLDALESKSHDPKSQIPNPQSQIPNPQSQIPNPTSNHPSLQRFTSLGEIADVILERINNQKECPYEPAGKPCDNCSMCSSRGF